MCFQTDKRLWLTANWKCLYKRTENNSMLILGFVWKHQVLFRWFLPWQKCKSSKAGELGFYNPNPFIWPFPQVWNIKLNKNKWDTLRALHTWHVWSGPKNTGFLFFREFIWFGVVWQLTPTLGLKNQTRVCLTSLFPSEQIRVQFVMVEKPSKPNKAGQPNSSGF